MHAGFTHVYNLLSNLCREGVEVVLVAGEPQEGMEPIEDIPGLTVHTIPLSNPVSRNIRALRKVLSIIRKEKIDLIHERYEMAGGAGSVASLLTGTPLVLEVNDPLLELNAKKWQQPFLRTLRRIQYWRSSAIICQTPQIKGVIWDGYPRSKTRIFVIPNGADPSRFLSTPLPEGKDEKRIGFIGSFMPWHGVRNLIRGFSEVVKKEPESRLILIGNHSHHEDELLGLTQELGIEERVEFTGTVPPDDVPELLTSCRVLVAPFAPDLDEVRKEHYEQFGFWWSPLKIFEYMAAGRPVVSPDLGMIPTYLGDAGLVYSPGDVKELAAKILELLQNDDLARDLGAHGREQIAQLYNWKTIAHITKMVYVSVLEG